MSLLIIRACAFVCLEFNGSIHFFSTGQYIHTILYNRTCLTWLLYCHWKSFQANIYCHIYLCVHNLLLTKILSVRSKHHANKRWILSIFQWMDNDNRGKKKKRGNDKRKEMSTVNTRIKNRWTVVMKSYWMIDIFLSSFYILEPVNH
jgi:hypothetical protein